jgi:hypothetical protein
LVMAPRRLADGRGLAEQDGIARQANDQGRLAVGGDPVEALGGAK